MIASDNAQARRVAGLLCSMAMSRVIVVAVDAALLREFCSFLSLMCSAVSGMGVRYWAKHKRNVVSECSDKGV